MNLRKRLSLNYIHTQGVTVFEVLMVLAMMVFLLVLTTSAFSAFNKRKALSTASTKILTTLEEARALTLASKSNTTYGVHFADTEIVLFKGLTYVSASEYSTTSLPVRVIATTTIAGSERDILFDRLSGKTNNNGTINISLISDSNASTTITVQVSGIAE